VKRKVVKNEVEGEGRGEREKKGGEEEEF